MQSEGVFNEQLAFPIRISTALTKRRESEEEPYETITSSTWYEPEGTEVTDPARIAELEERQRQKELMIATTTVTPPAE